MKLTKVNFATMVPAQKKAELRGRERREIPDDII